MAHNTSISLGERFTDFIAGQIKSCRYNSASDVMRAGLRLLEEHEVKVKALEAALIAGEASGAARPFDSEEFLAHMRGRHEIQLLAFTD